MSKQPHRTRGAESMSGGNAGRRTGASPHIESGAGTSRKTNVGKKASATKPQKKAA